MLKHTIIAVDDVKSILRTLKMNIEVNGHEVEVFTDPLESIERVKEIKGIKDKKCKIMIVDYRMSPINGDELVRRVKEIDPKMYFIFLTGQSTGESEEATMRKNGIDMYLKKVAGIERQVALLIETVITSIDEKEKNEETRDELIKTIEIVPKIFDYKRCNLISNDLTENLTNILDSILLDIKSVMGCLNMFINVEDKIVEAKSGVTGGQIYRGIGIYENKLPDSELFLNMYKKMKQTNSIVVEENKLLAPLFLVEDNDRFIGSLFFEFQDSVSDQKKSIIEIDSKVIAAAIIDNILNKNLEIQKDIVKQCSANMTQAFLDAIEISKTALNKRDSYTCQHSQGVKEYSVKIATRLMELGDYDEITEEYITKKLSIAALLHDIGKIGVEDAILNKPGKLSDEEMSIMKKHVLNAEDFFNNSSLAPLKEIALQHHENFDGSGYPYGLKGEKISLGGRILRVADVIDALGTDRPYRKKLPKDMVVSIIKEQSGTSFDPHILEIALQLIEENVIDISDK